MTYRLLYPRFERITISQSSAIKVGPLARNMNPQNAHRNRLLETTPTNNHVHLRQLPNQIMSKIFIVGLGDRSDVATEVAYLNLITSTCLFRRVLSLSTRRLWTSVLWKFEYSWGSPKLLRTRIDRTTTYLKGSAKATIDFLSRVNGCTVSTYAAIWGPIAHHLWRCRSISFRVSEPEQIQVFILLGGPVHYLRTLVVVGKLSMHKLQVFIDDIHHCRSLCAARVSSLIT